MFRPINISEPALKKTLLLITTALVVIIGVFSFFLTTKVKASVSTWIGTSGNWEDPTKWDNGVVPDENSCVTIDSNVTVTINGGTSISCLTMGNANATTTPVLTFNYDSIEIGAPLEVTTVKMYSGSQITHTAATSSINLLVYDTFTLDSGATINVSGKGFAGGACQTNGGGPGGGIYNGRGVAASYGGKGSSAADTRTYGSLTAPVDLGSGGSGGYSNSNGCKAGGSGGGAVKMYVASQTEINGNITANGNSGIDVVNIYESGSGSGGSVYIVTNELTGSGNIAANGGTTGFSASGGRISLTYNSYANTLTSIVANGGTSTATTEVSENGTVYLYDSDDDHLYITRTQYWKADPALEGSEHTYTSMTISGNSTLYLKSYYTDNTDGVGHTFTISDTLTIDSGSSMSANGYGYTGGACGANGSGPGGGIYNGYGVAGSYGGKAQLAADTRTYGSMTIPVNLGSGGAGSSTNANGCKTGANGGGAISINALYTVLNGTISANGNNGQYTLNVPMSGGGSGGSIYILTDVLSGTGSITANGGGTGYAGSGGRVSISYKTYDNTLTAITATGGSASAENGTVYQYNNEEDHLYITQTQYWKADPSLEGSSHSFSYMTITNNSTLYLKSYSTDGTDGVGHIFEVSYMVLDSGSSINADGYGYTGGACDSDGVGPGAGIFSGSAVGGSYGGLGTNAAEGRTYGSDIDPVDLGSGGSGGDTNANGCKTGSSGGGAIKISSTSFELNGDITADGIAGLYTAGIYESGGGSGGSVYVRADELYGEGTISANGGSGTYSGGGGRVAIYYLSDFSTVTATATKGSVNSDDGTVNITRKYYPSALSSDISLSQNYLLPGIQTDITEIYSDLEGYTDLSKVSLYLINSSIPVYEAVSFDITGTGLTENTTGGATTEGQGQGNTYFSVTFDSTVNYPTENDITVVWHIVPKWNWFISSNIELGVAATDSFNLWLYNSTTDKDIVYTNLLTFAGTLSVTGETTGALSTDQWIPTEEDITWSGLKVIFDGTNISPLDSDFDVNISDNYDNNWTQTESSGSNISIVTNSGTENRTINTHDIDIINIAEGGDDISDVAFSTKIDGTIPDIISIIGANNNVWQNTIPTLTWTDPSSISDDTFYITSDGTEPTATNNTFNTQEATYTPSSLVEGSYTLKVRPLSGSGLYGLTREYLYKYDKTAPSNVSSITATSVTQTQITLQWTNPTDALSQLNKVILLKNTTKPATNYTDGSLVYRGTDRTYTITSLTPSTQYFFTLYPYDNANNYSTGATIAVTTLAPVVIPPVDDGTDDDDNTPVVTPPTDDGTDTTEPEVEEPTQEITNEYVQELLTTATVFETTVPLEVKIENITKTNVNKSISVQQNKTIEISIPGEVLSAEDTEIQSVFITLNNIIYNLVKEDGVYKTSISAPSIKGTYDFSVLTIYQNNTSKKETLQLQVDPYGYVYYEDENTNEVRLRDIQVYLYAIIDGTRTLAEVEDNPFTTNEHGEFSFYVNPGTYVLTVNAEGFEPYESEAFVVENSVVNINIKLEKINNILPTILAISIPLVVSIPVIIVFVKKAHKKKTKK